MKKRSLGPWVALACVAGIILYFHTQGLRFYLIPSDSMEPTLKKSDYIGGFIVQPSQLQRGDIVIFTTIFENDYYVKRIIGLPGDVFAIFLGMVYINGCKLEEPYVINHGFENFGPMKIPAKKIFLMGDNRMNSYDSRKYGAISINRVEATASFIYNPIKRIGFIQRAPDYGLDEKKSKEN